VLVTVNDVTHLKKVASEYSTILTHSLHYQKLLQTIIDEINSVIYIKDKEGKFRFANQKLLNLFNLETEKEIIGRL